MELSLHVRVLALAVALLLLVLLDLDEANFALSLLSPLLHQNWMTLVPLSCLQSLLGCGVQLHPLALLLSDNLFYYGLSASTIGLNTYSGDPEEQSTCESS